MRKLVYSPDAIQDIKDLKHRLQLQFGRQKSREHIEQVRSGIKNLRKYPDVGISAKDRWEIDSEYLVAYIHHNYVFFTVTEDEVRIIDIIDEREDVMWKMFKVRNVTEGERYWGD